MAGSVRAGVIGLVATAAGLGAGEVAAAFTRPEAAPIVVVANRFIAGTPEWLKQFAIGQFGTSDKDALRIGIYAVIAALAVAVGLRAVERLRNGLIGVALFTLVGALCALTTSAHRPSDVVPTLVAGTATAAAVWFLVRRLASERGGVDARSVGPGTGPSGVEPSGVDPSGPDRRTVLIVVGPVAAAAAGLAWGGRSLQHRRFDAARSRHRVVLPAPVEPEPAALPARADLGRSPVPFVTRNEDFYRIDTAYVVPQIEAESWQLRITGAVERPLTLTFADLLRRPLVERWITLVCVSNEVGGYLTGTALWRGARLAPLLREAGIRPGADQLVCRSKDGMTIGTPVAAVMDGRDALLAVGMNGVPLPLAHGFPVRMVVPGLYGYVSACKWITEIEVTTFAAYDAYWVRNGWLAQGPIQLGSRIDTPAGGRRVRTGDTVTVAGVAWHQHVGVARVEVRVDDGPWMGADLGTVPSSDTWRQWTVPWRVVERGAHTVTVRAVSADGGVQDTAIRRPLPGAASGLHRITVTAT
ncbi:MAG: molybdopterin-dependent oxidoreductase [bacterium]